MPILIGFTIVISSVLGGYVLSHGELAALWQPYELLIIGGAAIGAFIASNPTNITKSVIAALPTLFTSSKYDQNHYMDLLALLHDLFVKWRKEGLMSIESDIESPESSEIFERYPRITMNQREMEFICDYLRICASGNMSPFELENLMDVEIETITHEIEQPASAIGRVGEALPGFGIVAAVMGIVITMKSLGGPPEVLGLHVAAALVGTFIGILLAYGFVSPLGVALEYKAIDETKVFECIKACIMAMVNGIPPQLAVEFGRKTLMDTVRPSFTELEDRIRGT